MFSLDGYRVLITGGSGSIGRSIAISMASCGAEVAISGTREDALKNVAEEIKEKTGKAALILQCDLSDTEKAKNLVKEFEDKLGPIDVLVNNAGINKDSLFPRMSLEDFDTVVDVNLRAIFVLMQTAVSSMGPRRFGRIINMTSVVGVTGNIGQANYCASKAGLIGLSKAVALEYAKRGVTVNCVAPGAINSPMIEKLSEQARGRFIAKIPMGRIGDPDDVSAVCCFLASSGASYITGQTFHVNGGMLMD
ncbi:MAG: 3-oxoacyl-[acyl-carrier-protein] reductase [Holosporales bacterium]|nr:3-oxoacyl-[acyl-carrier-protein] reductase [Holosporales bacterium]